MKDKIWLELLNSDYRDYRGMGKHEDRIENRVWLSQFLGALGADLSEVPEERVKTSLRSLRTVLRRVAERTAAKRRLGTGLMKDFNLFLDRAPLRRRFALVKDRPRLEFISAAGPLDTALAEIANSFVETVVRGDPSRVKVCQNKDCLWMFYDRSKNKSRKWCEEKTCANLMKVRRFREKHRKR